MFTENKISAIVKSQLPEHIRDSYPLFVKLLEYYYEYLEQDKNALELIQNAKKYQDIDKTADSFVRYFLQNYATDISANALLDKQILVKRIKDLYESKGSVPSFQLLFKLLYNDEIEIKYPYENVLKPSDGIWDQKFSIHILKDFGDESVFSDRVCVFKKDSITYTFIVSRAKKLDENYTELLLELKYNVIPFFVGGTIAVYNGTDKIYSGTIVPTTTTYQIISAGLGFKTGQIISVNLGSAVNTLVKIAKVNPDDGSIVALTFINYGWGYETPFIIELWNNLNFAVRSSFLVSGTNGFDENVYIEKYGDEFSANRYFESDYVRTYRPEAVLPYVNPHEGAGSYFASNTYTTFNLLYIDHLQNYVADELEIFEYFFPSPNPDDEGELPVDVAIIQFDLGTKAKYPGQYISYRGFPSEFDVRIQDDELYQPYAYQIQTNIDISVFYNAVKNIVHQAGTNLFSNRTLESVIDLKGNVEVAVSSNINIELHDTIDIDDYIIKTLNSYINDNVSTSEDFDTLFVRYLNDDIILEDNSNITLMKSISDNDVISIADNNFVNVQNSPIEDANIIDEVSITTSLNFIDNVSLNDFVVNLQNNEEESNIILSDNVVINRTLTLSDNVNIVDNLISSYNTIQQDTVNNEDSITYQFIKSLENNVTTNESISFAWTKNIVDFVTITDFDAQFETQNNESSVSLTDDISFTRLINVIDNVSIIDSDSYSLNKDLIEISTVSDSITISQAKLINDFVTITDFDAQFETQNNESSVSLNDSVSYSLGKSLIDNVSLTDNETIKQYETPKFDTSNTADIIYLTHYKNVFDNVSITDFAEQFETQNNESSVSLSDNISFTRFVNVTENVSITDDKLIEQNQNNISIINISDSISFVRYINLFETINAFDEANVQIQAGTEYLSVNDSINTEENFDAYLSNYASQDYFSELYSGQLVA